MELEDKKVREKRLEEQNAEMLLDSMLMQLRIDDIEAEINKLKEGVK